jgi:hypothetical protein
MAEKQGRAASHSGLRPEQQGKKQRKKGKNGSRGVPTQRTEQKLILSTQGKGII